MGEYWEFLVMVLQALWRLFIEAGMPVIKAYLLFTVLCLVAYTLMGEREDEVEEREVEKFGQLGEELAKFMIAFEETEAAMMGFHRRGIMNLIGGMTAEEKTSAKILVLEFFQRFPRWENNEVELSIGSKVLGLYSVRSGQQLRTPTEKEFTQLMDELREELWEY